MTETITVRSLAKTDIGPAEIARLFNVAFGEYEGVVAFTSETMAWYLQRPGLGREHTFVALQGDLLAGGIMVTVAPVVLGGEPVRCGIVDSVMTLPECRRQGIATRLMQHALEWMRAEGLEASLLYTEPGSGGHRIYGRLGYVERAAVHYHFAPRAPAGKQDPCLRALRPGEEPLLMERLNAWLGRCDGFVPVDPALWRWRRETRPPSLPCSVFVLEERGAVQATGALCHTRVQIGGQDLDLDLMTDIAGASPEYQMRVVHALLAQVPPGHGAAMLSGSHDAVLPALATELGMACHAEVAMAIPFGKRAEETLRRPPEGWYTLAESLVGV